MAPGTDPAARGPFTPQRQAFSIPGTGGANLSADVYYPRHATGGVEAAAAPCPVLVLGHGFSQAKEQHVNQGLHWASRGYVAIIPSFNGGSDHSRNADDLVRCIDWMVARHADPASIFHQRMRLDRVGATGHSAGGLSAIVAASRDGRIRAVAPMDPVDNGGLGTAALANLAVPVAITYSEPSSCNASGSAATLYGAATGRKRGIKIIGANHSDPQDPVSFLSGLTCGSANTNRQALYRRYVTGWFDYYLKGEAAAAPWVFPLPGSAVAADRAANRITYAETPPASPMAEWRSIHFWGAETAGAPEADPDGDGLPNLVEYGLGLDPWSPARTGLPRPAAVQTNNNRFLALTFTRVMLATDLSYMVETSSNLLQWAAGSTYAGTNSPADSGLTTEVSRAGTGLESVTVRDLTPAGTATPRFLRLRLQSR
jgi:dienelactone hydrolase